MPSHLGAAGAMGTMSTSTWWWILGIAVVVGLVWWWYAAANQPRSRAVEGKRPEDANRDNPGGNGTT